MIVNADLGSLLKSPPSVSSEWRERVERWLRTLEQELFSVVFRTQLEMLDAVLGVERQIKELEKERKGLKLQIPHLKANGKFDFMKGIQLRVTEIDRTLNDLKYCRDCILFVGDTIASRLLEVDAIKHFASFQSAGFLLGKSGLEAEIDAAWHFLREGNLVLFNDLTHSIRVGDLTLVKDGRPRTFEVKSAAEGYADPETARQILTPMAIHDFIEKDVSAKPQLFMARPSASKEGVERPAHGPAGKRRAVHAVRVDSGFPEDWHWEIGPNIYRKIYRERVVQIVLGKKHYLAATDRNRDELNRALESLTAVGQWVVGNVRRRVTEYGDLPPFSRWFKPSSTLDIMTGSVVVLSAFNMSDLAGLFTEKGLVVNWTGQQNDLFTLRLTHQSPPATGLDFVPSNFGLWHRLRVMYSFLSVETFVQICTYLMSPEAAVQMQQKVDASIRTQDRDPGPWASSL